MKDGILIVIAGLLMVCVGGLLLNSRVTVNQDEIRQQQLQIDSLNTSLEETKRQIKRLDWRIGPIPTLSEVKDD